MTAWLVCSVVSMFTVYRVTIAVIAVRMVPIQGFIWGCSPPLPESCPPLEMSGSHIFSKGNWYRTETQQKEYTAWGNLRLNTRRMYRFWPKQLPILLLFLFHISRLQSHYPAVTPKCLISTGVIWSIGVKCLIRTGNMVISSCHLKTTNGLKNAPEAISEGLKFKNFPGGHASTHLYFCQFVVLWAILFPPALQL